MREIRADLHLHTCLSPCGALEMVPSAIVRRAREKGLDVIAICDHNSLQNVDSVVRAGQRESVGVLPGIEITSREEVHVVGLFAGGQELGELQALVDRNLPGENDVEAFGPQVVVDEWDEPVALSSKLLIGATTLTLEQVVEAVHQFGGLAIAAHVDREGFGLLGQLGLVPPGLELDALEVSARASHRQWDEQWPDHPVVTSSDAHRLDDIGRCWTGFLARAGTLAEIGKALQQEGGRRVVVR